MATKVKRLNTVGNVANVVQKTAYLKDVQASGVAGGSVTTGVFSTVRLNTVEDPHSIIVSLSSDQFILAAGTYKIRGIVPASVYSSSGATGDLSAKSVLKNISDNTNDIIGYTTSDNTAGANYRAYGLTMFEGIITITTNKTFEVQCRIEGTSSTIGRPIAAGIDEVYSIIEITKIETLDEAY